jgi:hypothetical protein
MAWQPMLTRRVGARRPAGRGQKGQREFSQETPACSRTCPLQAKGLAPAAVQLRIAVCVSNRRSVRSSIAKYAWLGHCHFPTSEWLNSSTGSYIRCTRRSAVGPTPAHASTGTPKAALGGHSSAAVSTGPPQPLLPPTSYSNPAVGALSSPLVLAGLTSKH